jgi:hypothetical protein
MHDEPRIMSQIAQLLERLDGPARSRIIGWTVGAFDIQGIPPSDPKPSQATSPTSQDLRASRLGKFTSDTEDWLVDEQDYTLS